MSRTEQPGERPSRRLIDPKAAGVVGLVAVVLVVAAALAFALLRPSEPLPADLAGDPLLANGYTIYTARCAGCHGERGRGDGPIARNVQAPPPGDLTSAQWKHGGTPAEVLAVIRDGVPNTAMSGFGKFRILDKDQIRAVTAYVFHLGGREVPAELRQP